MYAEVVIDMAELVIERVELLFGRQHAGLDAYVVPEVHVPARWRGRRLRGRAAAISIERSQNVCGSAGKPSDV